MHPIHDVDAILLLATALSSKRRPAELVEIIAATELIQGAQGTIPSETKLSDAFGRLSRCGLLCAPESGFALTADAQAIMAAQRRKAETAELLFGIKASMAAYEVSAEHPPIVLAAGQLAAAIITQRSAGEGAGKNLLVPKPKPADTDNRQRPGQRQRKPMPARRRKD